MRRNGGVGRAAIKYEILHEFCFGCGKLGHIERMCNSEITVSDEGDGGPMYDHWIRADIQKRIREQCRFVGTKQGA